MKTPEHKNDPEGRSRKDTPKKRTILSLDKLNLIIAISAVLISAASFIATYIQSEAALKQVKAETWPYLQIDNSNYDSDRREQIIVYKIENAGVGPAALEQFELSYKGQRVTSVLDLIGKCCAVPKQTIKMISFTTDSPSPMIIPAGEKQLVFSMDRNPGNEPLWHALNDARWELEAKGCYCSLLDECFETNFRTEPIPVGKCTRNPDTRYRG